MDKTSLINFPLSIGRYLTFINYITELAYRKKPAMVCVANVHMFIEAYKRNTFLQIINKADVVTPDGRPLIWALRLLYGIKQDRVAGMDLLPDLLKEMELQNISAYFYGGTEAMLKDTKVYLEQTYPNLKSAGFNSPPFAPQHIVEDEIITQINNSSPCVVFVVLGCPKQEKWMASMKDKINAVMIGIGGALPVMLGMQKRAPRWMQDSGFEWLYRLLQEPQRLFGRYINTNSLFLWIFFREFLRIKVWAPLGFSKSSL